MDNEVLNLRARVTEALDSLVTDGENVTSSVREMVLSVLSSVEQTVGETNEDESFQLLINALPAIAAIGGTVQGILDRRSPEAEG